MCDLSYEFKPTMDKLEAERQGFHKTPGHGHEKAREEARGWEFMEKPGGSWPAVKERIEGWRKGVDGEGKA